MQINDWNEVKIVESTDANVLKYVFSKEDAVAKVEGGDGLPPDVEDMASSAFIEERYRVAADWGVDTSAYISTSTMQGIDAEANKRIGIRLVYSQIEIERLKGLLQLVLTLSAQRIGVWEDEQGLEAEINAAVTGE